MTNSTIQQNVMRRVRTVHAVRPLLSGQILSLGVIAVALWGIGREVFVAQVFANMPSITHVSEVVRFMSVALINTDTVVQVLVAIVAAAGIWMAVDTIKSLKQGRVFAY